MSVGFVVVAYGVREIGPDDPEIEPWKSLWTDRKNAEDEARDLEEEDWGRQFFEAYGELTPDEYEHLPTDFVTKKYEVVTLYAAKPRT